MASRPPWGLNSEILKIIYHGAIKPLLLYCASAYEHVLNKKYAQKKLSQVQRGFALLICKGYRTLSTDAALVIAGIPPLYLSGLYSAGVSDIKRKRKNNFQNCTFDCDYTMPFLAAGHPAVQYDNLYIKYCDNVHTVLIISTPMVHDSPKATKSK